MRDSNHQPHKPKREQGFEELKRIQAQKEKEKEKEKEKLRQEALLCVTEQKTELTEQEAKDRSALFTLFASEQAKLPTSQFHYVDPTSLDMQQKQPNRNSLFSSVISSIVPTSLKSFLGL